MSTAPPAPDHAPAQLPKKSEIRIISHSNLFYWWPVWALGYLMALVSYFSGDLLAIVPPGTVAMPNVIVNTIDGPRDVLVLPKGTKLLADQDNTAVAPSLHISRSKNPGVLFVVVLLIVITITNVPLRGLWSAIVIGIIIFMSIIFATLGWWDTILAHLNQLDIRITTGGYVVMSTVLLVLWLVIFFLFDEQIYMVFTPGQFRVRLEIGDAETAYDTTGMTIQKQRSDLFRHWILGLGSGDLIVRTTGAQSHQFDMPNVLFLGRKVREIEEMFSSRQVLTAAP